MNELLAISDYRAKTFQIYHDVRERLNEEDPLGAHEMWKNRREELWRDHPASSVPDDLRDEWKGIPYWKYDKDFAYTVDLRARAPMEGRDEPQGTVTLSGHKGPWGEVFPAGVIELPIGQMYAMWMIQYGGGLFVAFRDETNGTQTYDGGRYLLDGPKGSYLGTENNKLRVDLNFAYHPSCARDPEWNCPLALEPALTGIPAGEKLEKQIWHP